MVCQVFLPVILHLFLLRVVSGCAEPTLKDQYITLRQVLSSSLRGNCSLFVQRQVQSRYFSQGSEQFWSDSLQTYITLSYIQFYIYL